MDNKNKNEIYCSNCGKKGHIYKNCFNPIISYGIICVKLDNININNLLKKINNNNLNSKDIFYLKKMLNKINDTFLEKNLKYLLIKRRNSISILEFIRGKYKLNDLNYILNIFNLMTIQEKNKIRNLSFKELWNDLWNIQDVDLYKQEYDNAEKKYNLLKEGIVYYISNIPIKLNLQNILDKTDNRYDDTEWGFPKGRRNNQEKDIQCAIREFYEETNFNNKDYQILNIDKQIETYTSINNVKYKHIYYVSQIITNKNPIIDYKNKNQTDEVGDIKWLNYNQCLEKLRNYHLDKINVLNNIHNQLKLLLLEIKNIINKNTYHNHKQNDLIVSI
jgi:8-oxo-dGTP pyrophosphatase MutT (NUDIX family)